MKWIFKNKYGATPSGVFKDFVMGICTGMLLMFVLNIVFEFI